MEPVQPEPQPPESESGLDPAEEKAWISRLVLLHEVPLPGEMSEEQNAGTKCMWCGAGDQAELRPRNGMLPVWPLRACPPCIEARAAKVKTFCTWAEHIADCDACQLVGRCPAAMPLADAHAAAVKSATGSPLVTLMCCTVQEDDVSNPSVVPLSRIGCGSAHHSYMHVPRCPKGALRVVPAHASTDGAAMDEGARD
ncbi:hypothetical protein [Streptomyces sp. LaBMicrA B280]|uniref:hypothetical protein n=1 Tax=Streptomyces sp. LaBMicrA B280 TaxID=3391001 RepID=UPI003BA66F49